MRNTASTYEQDQRDALARPDSHDTAYVEDRRCYEYIDDARESQ